MEDHMEVKIREIMGILAQVDIVKAAPVLCHQGLPLPILDLFNLCPRRDPTFQSLVGLIR